MHSSSLLSLAHADSMYYLCIYHRSYASDPLTSKVSARNINSSWYWRSVNSFLGCPFLDSFLINPIISHSSIFWRCWFYISPCRYSWDSLTLHTVSSDFALLMILIFHLYKEFLYRIFIDDRDGHYFSKEISSCKLEKRFALKSFLILLIWFALWIRSQDNLAVSADIQ